MLKEIRHTFHFRAGLQSVVAVLTEGRHIQKWWTKDSKVDDGRGIFQWKSHGWRVELNIEKSSDNQSVTWCCTASNMQNTDAWEGSTMTFSLFREDQVTRLVFAHTNYKNSPCYDVCLEGWNFVLGKSLKSYLESGKGMPYSG